MQVELDKDGAGKVFRLVEALEDLDDVQNVFANFDVPDDVMELARRTAARRRSRGPGARIAAGASCRRARTACAAVVRPPVAVSVCSEHLFGRKATRCACWGSTPG